MSATKRDEVLSLIASVVRVMRPTVLDLVMPASNARAPFYRLPVLDHAALWNPRLRTAEVRATGLELDVLDLGRKAHKIDWNDRESVQSLANSVTIWMNKHLVERGIIGTDEFSVLVDEL